MTSLDPATIIRQLREERRVLGQYRNETIERLIAATERTAQWPLPGYRPEPAESAAEVLDRTGPAKGWPGYRRGPTPHRRDIADTDELVPLPRGGRITYPNPGRSATILSFPAVECSARHPKRGLLCGEAPGHRGSHVAYGVDNRVIDEWPNTAPVSPEAGA